MVFIVIVDVVVVVADVVDVAIVVVADVVIASVTSSTVYVVSTVAVFYSNIFIIITGFTDRCDGRYRRCFG